MPIARGATGFPGSEWPRGMSMKTKDRAKRELKKPKKKDKLERARKVVVEIKKEGNK